MDMQQIDLPDSSVDAVVSRFGYMLVPDPARALRETRRVLRAGCPLAFATWAPAQRNPWATAYAPVLIERGLQEPPKPGEAGQFALSSRGEIEPLVRAAGFDEVSLTEVPVQYRFRDWPEYVRVVTSLGAALRALLGTLDEATRGEVDAAARARIERFRSGEGYAPPGVALVTSAR
jgi:SAM-dependent methyltransferase